MKQSTAVLALLAAITIVLSANDLPTATTNATVAISLTDQWERPATLKAPLARTTILTVADRAGAGQINDWVAPLKKQFGTNLHFFAVADVRAVPGPLRGMVRRRFAKEYAYPVGLDWQSAVAKQLSIKPQSANLFVLDHSGLVQHSVSGARAPKPMKALTNAIAGLLSKSREPIVAGRVASAATARAPMNTSARTTYRALRGERWLTASDSVGGDGSPLNAAAEE